MKRIQYVLLILVLLLLSGCGATKTNIQENPSNLISDSNSQNSTSESQSEEETPSSSDESQQKQEKNPANNETQKILIAYFSWSENAVQDNIDAMTSASVKTPGNVTQLATWIAEETNGDLFSIQVTESYPADWDGCLARANDEKTNNIHPELVQTLDNMDDYDIVFLGYPNWWYSCPMAIHSFLNAHNLSGKQIYLFCSHGTGGLANSVNDIAADIPEAILSDDVFHVFEDETTSAKADLVSWLQGMKN